MDLRIDADEVIRLASRFERGPAIVREELTQEMRRATITTANNVKRLTPVDTGRLRNSMTNRVESGGSGVTGEVGTNVRYARWVEEGRGPVVARGRALRFEVGGRVLFRKHVGPARGRFMFKRGLEASRSAILAGFRLAAERIARRVVT